MCSAQAQQRPEFERIASYQALGGLVASAAAPGPTPGSERIYASYLYADSTLDIVAINPEDGAAEVFHNPAPGEYGARNIAVGPAGDVYFGTLPHAHFLRLDPKSQRLVDLGRPSANEEYIWDVAFGADRKLYGVTYPGCRLVSYDPATGKLADLGRMDPTEKYGRWIVGGRDGFLYIGIGTAKAQIAVYDTRNGEMREVLPKDAQIVGTAQPYLGVDGKVYATVGDRLFGLSGFTLREIAAADKVDEIDRDVLNDGRVVHLGEDGSMTVVDPRTHRESKVTIAYSGEQLQLFRIAFGPDGILYGSSILPLHFVKIDVAAHRVEKIAQLGGGEAYSLLAHKGRLLMGAYAGLAPLMSYDPAQPTHPAASGNPALLNFAGSDEHWRPQAMIEGHDGIVYVGGTAGYGALEGPLVAWDAPNDPAHAYGNLVHNQSVVSLAVSEGGIVGGTTIEGGGGSHPTEHEARVFLWDPAQKRLLWDLVPVSGASAITDLITSKRGLIYGIAHRQGQYVLFTLDPRARRIIATQALPFHEVVYNSVASTGDGEIWGLAEEGIFRIDDATHQAKLIAASPAPVTGGFALHDGAIYFISGSSVYRYNRVGRHAH
jgi:streptogramin lyase